MARREPRTFTCKVDVPKPSAVSRGSSGDTHVCMWELDAPVKDRPTSLPCAGGNASFAFDEYLLHLWICRTSFATALSVYNWKAGKSKRRRRQLAKLVSVRKIGKKVTIERLQRL